MRSEPAAELLEHSPIPAFRSRRGQLQATRMERVYTIEFLLEDDDDDDVGAPSFRLLEASACR